ncbi:hypothetical protein QQ045_008175 [Rhodiola kirilowii]
MIMFGLISYILEPKTGHDKLPQFTKDIGFHHSLHGGDINSKIWVAWRDGVQVSLLESSAHHLTVMVEGPNSIKLICSFVYASLTRFARSLLWSTLLDKAPQYTGPWLVTGDFNVISSWVENKGGARGDLGAMFDFNDFQVQARLSDAGYTGTKYTWSNNRQGSAEIWLRLINGAALATLPDLKVHHLARVASDHCPLLISIGSSTRRPVGFKYLRAWHAHTCFLDVVRENWAHSLHANPILNLALKWKSLRRCFKEWNWNIFGNIHHKLSDLTSKIANMVAEIQRHHSDVLANALA